jgi:TRAP-type C4-dicarboxylate transport system substrate-binding protein
MKKKAIFIGIIAAFVVMGFLGLNTVSARPIELNFNLFISSQHNRFVQCHTPWIKMIEERTGGKVKITPYFSNSLTPMPEKFSSTLDGIADISEGLAFVNAGRFPMTEMLMLPELGLRTATRSAKAWWHIYKTMPAMQKEYEGVKVLFLHTSPSLMINTKKPIHSLADLRGLKIQTSGVTPVETARALGFTPVAMNPGEVYQALDKGIIDGCTSDYEMSESRRIYEVTTSVISNFYIGHGQFYMIMNQGVWDGLPEDVRKVFEELTGDWAVNFYGTTRDKGEEEAKKHIVAKGIELIPLPDDELAKARELVAPVRQKYAEELEAKGLPGKAALAEWEKFAVK